MSSKKDKNNTIAKIAAAYAARTDVTPDDILELISKLRQEFSLEDLTNLSGIKTRINNPKSAIPVSQAVTQNQVFCLCCGKGFKMLKRHLGAEHGLNESEYRELFDLPDSMPLVAPGYSDRKAAHAKRAGLGKYQRGLDTVDRVEVFSE